MERTARKNDITPPPADAELWTFGEVAYHLRVSVASIRRLVDQGKLGTVPVTVGDKRLIPRAAVRAYLDQNLTVVDPTAPAPVRTSKPIPHEPKGSVKASWVKDVDYFGLDRKPGRPRKASTK